MKITKSSKKSGGQRIDKFNTEMQDFKCCPECRKVISRQKDIRIVTWEDGLFSPYQINEVLEKQAEWPIKIIARCPQCGCEWESDEF